MVHAQWHSLCQHTHVCIGLVHHQELRAKLLAEAEQSARQNAAVAMRWADLFSIEVPQDLYQEIEKQRQACEKIISSKDKLISGTVARGYQHRLPQSSRTHSTSHRGTGWQVPMP